MVKSKKLSRGSLAVLLLALMLALSMVVGITGAWFTDKAEIDGGNEFTFGSILVSVDDTDGMVIARGDDDDGVDVDVSKAMPGDTITYSFTVTNDGENALYYLAKITFADAGASDFGEDQNGLYYLSAGDNPETTQATAQAPGAGILQPEGEAELTFSFTIPGADTGNLYQHAEVTVAVTVYAVQAANIGDAEDAYDYLATAIAGTFPDDYVAA